MDTRKKTKMLQQRLAPYKKFIVTGASGFLGQAIVQKLQDLNKKVLTLSSKDVDLRDQQATLAFFKNIQTDQNEVLIHCAVQGGGIGWMKEHPVASFVDNIYINSNILVAAHRYGIQKFIGVSSACIYPRIGKLPFVESEIWDGYPEPINGGYALSKRMMMEMGQAYAQQYGFSSSFPILANLYGVGDHISKERAHVIADLMIRCSQKPLFLEVWGTGNCTREFLYIDDAVEGVLAMIDAPAGSAINIGSGQEVSILDLAHKIIETFGLDIDVVLNSSKPDGQPRKVMDVQRARDILGFEAQISLEEGLKRTVAWYNQEQSRHKIEKRNTQ
jgi:GDP-L-fucose synthase